MCGILGIKKSSGKVDITEANEALDLLSHRGPDNQQSWTNHADIYLGHCRLSIIDLNENANQPFFDLENEVGIIFNGEIYNYQRLKDELRFDQWRTNSDTEVILEGYKEKGINFFSKLRGIYAFGIYDGKLDKIILYRDPSGVKPLYYYNSNCLIFSSEIKSIKKFAKNKLTLNENVISNYLNLGYCVEPYTAYNEIHAVEPGICLEFNGKAILEKRITGYSYEITNVSSTHKLNENVKDFISKAVQRNLVSDVPVIFALSGGIDSSLVTAMAKNYAEHVESVTVSFNQRDYNESEIATAYSQFLDIKNYDININVDIDIDHLNRLLDHFDQPYADSSLIPAYYLNKEARKYSKVLIGGDGGDELFNGYPSMTYLRMLFKNQFSLSLLKVFPGLSIINSDYVRKIDRLKKIAGSDLIQGLYFKASWFPSYTEHENRSVFNFDERQSLDFFRQAYFNNSQERLEGQIVDFYFRIILRSDYLRKIDMMSMINGVEYRVPLLDEDLVKFAFSIPFSYKSSLRKTKIPLRRLHSQIFSGLGSNLSKSGFSIPLHNYLSKETKMEIKEFVMESDVSNWIRKEYTAFLFTQFINYSASKLISQESVNQRVLIIYSLARWTKINGF